MCEEWNLWQSKAFENLNRLRIRNLKALIVRLSNRLVLVYYSILHCSDLLNATHNRFSGIIIHPGSSCRHAR